MGYDSIDDYIFPCIYIIVDLIAAGTILRCLMVLIKGNEEDSIGSVMKKVKKKIIVAVLAICAVEVMRAIADVYS